MYEFLDNVFVTVLTCKSTSVSQPLNIFSVRKAFNGANHHFFGVSQQVLSKLLITV